MWAKNLSLKEQEFKNEIITIHSLSPKFTKFYKFIIK